MKTSTGFGPGGATVADVALMRRVVGAEMGVKAAGGVRDLEGLKAMVAAGATRVGASAGVKIVQESKGQKPAGGAARLLSARRRRLALFHRLRRRRRQRLHGRSSAGNGTATPAWLRAIRMRRRSSRPTSHCFSGIVLIRTFSCTAQSPNASMPRISIGFQDERAEAGSFCSSAPISRRIATTRSGVVVVRQTPGR